MILKFPEPYPDETFYSWIARYHDQSANGLYKFTAQRLYGESPSCAIYGLPSGLEQFCKTLLPLLIYTPEDIIKNHTLLPYFSSAVSSQQMGNARSKMLHSCNTGVHGQLGSLTSLIKNFQYLRYCPVCLEEDKKHMGEPYWHRCHQLPGVLVCPFHQVPTLNSVVDKQNFKHLHYATASQYAQPNVRQKSVVENDKLVLIARESSKLLTEYRSQISCRMYRSELLKTGFNQGSFINQSKLYNEFVAYWHRDLLESIDALPDPEKHHWLRRICRNSETGSHFHPLYHILMRGFLDYKKQQLSSKANDQPQIKRQYPCPNPFCNNHFPHSAILQRTHRQQKNGPLYGTIACTCGYSFSCNLEAENYYTGHIISYGEHWLEKFKSLIEAGYSVPQMIEAMSVSRGVVIRKVQELNLKPNWNIQIPSRNKLSSRLDNRVLKERKHFQNYRKKYPNHSRSEIKNGMRAGYKFLERQDRDWLLEHLPTPKKPAPKKELINWKKRDGEYREQVKSIVKELLSQPGKPIRITPAIISRIMGKRNLFSKVALEKIPGTATYLKEACDENQYYQRRFNWAKEQLIKTGKTITRSNLIYTACLGYNLTEHQESMVQELLEAGNEETYSLPKNQASKT